MERTSAGSEKATSFGSTCIGGISKNSLSFLHPAIAKNSANNVIENIFFI